jgi:signal transduction histidine kinase/ActR/RegA family two-component response regulator
VSEAPDPLERRILILAPSAKDASFAQTMMRNAGIACSTCSTMEGLLRELQHGAGAVLVPEENMSHDGQLLSDAIRRQPPWSDLPVLLLTQHGADSTAVGYAIEMLSNVTLVERPVTVAALVSTVRTALRARGRQYETRALLQTLREADKRKDEFLATLAHELRNPLAPIRNSVDIIRLSAGNSPMVQQLADMMGRQVSHMVRLVDDLLEVSRITRGKIELRRTHVDLGAVVAAAVETSRPLIESAGHQLVVSLPEEPLRLEADPTRLAQVFANLLNNAAKYTERGGRIDLAAKADETTVAISVRDTGVGMAPALIARAFDMFAQADSTHVRAQGGLGIGLTLVRSLVEMHGGSVTGHSEGPGLGSEFVVHLPLVHGADQPGSAHAAPEAPRKIQAPTRVLVVDDNQDAANALGAMLKILGAEVDVAHNGRSALEFVQIHRPAIAFLDIGMPDMDGYELARRIQTLPDSQTTLLVALTGWGQAKDRLETKAAGFHHHLVKPTDIDTIQALLNATTSRPANE